MDINWGKIGSAVASVAPLLGAALGGPGGAALGAIVAKELGTESTPEAVAAVTLNPDGSINQELTIKLKEIEIDNDKSLREYIFRMSELSVADIKDARAREVEVVKTGSKNYTQNILAAIGVIGFFATTGYVLAFGMVKMSQEAAFVVGNLTGMVAAIAKDIYGYYFGSSKSSELKTELLAKK